jgi:predicted nucleic acid-binding protein
VVDTPILISRLFAPQSPPFHLLELWREGRVDLFISP